eukprot:gene2256-2568_t
MDITRFAAGTVGSSARHVSLTLSSDSSSTVAAHARHYQSEDVVLCPLHETPTCSTEKQWMPVPPAPVAVAQPDPAASAASQVLAADMCLYCEGSSSSTAALEQANMLLGRVNLPDGVKYLPVLPDSFLFKAASGWQLPAFATCLGSSYFQRMLARNQQLLHAARSCPGMDNYVANLQDKHVVRLPQLSGPEAEATLSTLRTIQITCVYLALKVADKVHALGLLKYMLSQLGQGQAAVSSAAAASIEAKCLDVLDWRLGPFFSEDDNLEDDELDSADLLHLMHEDQVQMTEVN